MKFKSYGVSKYAKEESEYNLKSLNYEKKLCNRNQYILFKMIAIIFRSVLYQFKYQYIYIYVYISYVWNKSCHLTCDNVENII